MKKHRYLFLFAAILIIVAVGGWYIFSTDDSYIRKANENMDILGFKLLSAEASEKDKLAKGFTLTGGFGCKPYKNEKDGIELVFSGFPDVLDKYVLIEITTTNRDCSFYGIRVGGSGKEAESILIKNGFKKDNVPGNNLVYKIKKLSVSLVLDENGMITRISIRLSSTNREGVVF